MRISYNPPVKQKMNKLYLLQYQLVKTLAPKQLKNTP